MATILIPFPAADVDLAESAVPWRIPSAAGHEPVFAPPAGKMGQTDARILTGKGLGILAPLLRADANGCQASCTADGRSVLFGRKTTALTRRMELGAWILSRSWLGDCDRTYARTVQGEISGLLAAPDDFITGPGSLRRGSPRNLEAGFTVADGCCLSARWSGNAHRFAAEFAALCRT